MRFIIQISLENNHCTSFYLNKITYAGCYFYANPYIPAKKFLIISYQQNDFTPKVLLFSKTQRNRAKPDPLLSPNPASCGMPPAANILPRQPRQEILCQNAPHL